MEDSLSTRPPLFSVVLGTLLANPWIWLFQAFLTLILTTRAVTQIRSTSRAPDVSTGTKEIERIPYWIPYYGTTPLFSLRSQSWLLSQSRAHRSGVFALHLSGRDHIVLTTPTQQAQLSDPVAPISLRSYEEVRTRRFFSLARPSHGTIARISKAVLTCTEDKSRITKLTLLLESQACNLISPAKSWVDQAPWERSSDVTVLSEKPALSVSASLPTLVKDFSSYIILSTLLGTSFLEANPGFIVDVFAFSSKYAMFMTGLPYWLAPGLGPPALARERCLLTLDGLVSAIIADLDGRSMQGTGVGMLYDLEDVNTAIWHLIKQARSDSSQISTRMVSSEILEVVWHLTFSSVNTVVWMLTYLFMDGDSNKLALQSIREELKHIVQISEPKPTGLAFEDPPQLRFSPKVDNKLDDLCPVMRGALLEVRRLEYEPEEYMVVTEDFILQSDSTSRGREKLQLRKGDHVYAAYGATNKDTQHWDRPRRFAPSRFISKDDAGVEKSAEKGLSQVRSTSQSILQADVLCIVAALLAFYDIGSLDDGELKHPGTKIIAGVGIAKDVKAKVSRRSTKT